MLKYVFQPTGNLEKNLGGGHGTAAQEERVMIYLIVPFFL